jgi:hypothetical protein
VIFVDSLPPKATRKVLKRDLQHALADRFPAQGCGGRGRHAELVAAAPDIVFPLSPELNFQRERPSGPTI